jgi:hypothetical protein
VCEKSVLRKIFEPQREEVTEVWIKLYNELHNLHATINIIIVMKSRRREMLLAWHR